MKIRLFRPRTLWLPTWQTWLGLFVVGGISLWICLASLYPFLAVREPVESNMLVVEGWAPDEVLEQVVQEYHKHPYQWVVTIGCGLEAGHYLKEYHSYAEMAAASLVKMGLSTNTVVAAPAEKVAVDRTFTSAQAFAHWLKKDHPDAQSINIVSCSAHARRTRYLFRKALGESVTVGILAMDNEEVNSTNWYKTSAGVREVIGELLAFGYARFWFTPPSAEP